MAKRRMIAGDIIGQEAFLEMTPGAQALYFQLLVDADDDGFVANPKKIARGAGRNTTELDELVVAGYVLRFGSGVIVITHWCAQNTLRNDRYKQTECKAEFEQLCLDDAHIYHFKKDTVSSMATNGIPTDNQTSTNGIPNISKENISQGISQDNITQEKKNQENTIQDQLQRQGQTSKSIDIDPDMDIDDAEVSPSVVDSLNEPDPIFSELCRAIPTVDTKHYPRFREYRAKLDESVIRYAIKMAGENCAGSFEYFTSILDSYVTRGFKTVDEVRRHEEDRHWHDFSSDEKQRMFIERYEQERAKANKA